MCQLTAVNLHSRKFNESFLTLQMQKNTDTVNRDGWGWASARGIHKQTGGFNCIYNITNVSANLGTSGIMLGHVRQATVGANNAKLLKEENSHPFEGKNFVLMHNGSLEPKDAELWKTYPGMIDSQIFHAELEKAYLEKKTVTEALVAAYEKFTGKFAFLIYHKSKKQFYAARGETAALHHLIFPDVGWVINTSETDLHEAMIIWQNQVCLWTGTSVDIGGLKPKLLKDNSIYLLGDTVEKVGEIVEQKKVVATAGGKTTSIWKDTTDTATATGGTKKEEKLYYPKEVEILYDFCALYAFSMQYLDEFVHAVTGKFLLQITQQDLEFLIQTVIPQLTEYHRVLTNTNATKNLLATWRSLVNLTFNDVYVHHKFPELKFPWFLNSVQDLRAARTKLKEEQEK